MIPLLLKGHERSITYVVFNADGDLLFTCAKDHTPTVWRTETGERLGTYEGHGGAVWQCAVTRDSRYLLTCSADNSVRLWRVETGECLFVWHHHGPARGVAWSDDEKQFVTITDTFATRPTQLNVFDFSEDLSQQAEEPRLVIQDPDDNRVKITSVNWLSLDEGIITSNEKGQLRIYDPKSGECVRTVKAHNAPISSFHFNKEKTLLATSSHDQSSKLWDVKTWQCVKRYVGNTPLNAVAISPLKEHIIMGGGQEARNVAMTTGAAGAGKFETRFYHLAFEKELGRVKGHFGPVNTLAWEPTGAIFASGAEDGYVRLHKLDPDYFKLGEEDDLDDKALKDLIDLGIGQEDFVGEEEEAEMARIPEKFVQPLVEKARAKATGAGQKSTA